MSLFLVSSGGTLYNKQKKAQVLQQLTATPINKHSCYSCCCFCCVLQLTQAILTYDLHQHYSYC